MPYQELLEKQKAADLLVHVEGLSLKNRLEVRQSFSTKLVDFFEMGKCIFAIGPIDTASIAHLIQNNAAIVARSADEIYAKLRTLLAVPEEISAYAERAYLCGQKHHQKNTIQKMLTDDFQRTVVKCDK